MAGGLKAIIMIMALLLVTANHNGEQYILLTDKYIPKFLYEQVHKWLVVREFLCYYYL